MKINEICNLLRDELLNNDYKYGFVIDNKKYTPNMTGGFDYEYYNLTMTVLLQKMLGCMKFWLR